MSAPILVLAAACAGLGVAFAMRVWRWRRGRAARVPWVRGLLSAPRRYLRDVHHVVAREPRAARMHILAAGGFVVSMALVVIVHGVWPWPPLALLLYAALAVTAVGAVLVLARRRGAARARLSGGAFGLLGWALLAQCLFLSVATLPIVSGSVALVRWSQPLALATLCLGVWSAFELIVRMGTGPMKHALNGMLHLAWHPRPERFERSASARALTAPDLSNDPLGVAQIGDFAWNRLLQFDACVECGKCEAACPAFAAGLPLNPKALIQDIAHIEPPPLTPAYAGNPHPGRAEAPSILGAIAADTIWSCTTCAACVEECPMMIEHVDAVIDLRRAEVMREGRAPAGAVRTLARLRDEQRLEFDETWASDLDVRVLEEGGVCDVLLWAGASALEARTRRTLRATWRLLSAAGVDVAILGPAELDCGDLARRLGDEDAFQRLARANIATFSRRRFNRIVTCDPHALHCLRNEYPALGGNYAVLHHSALFAASLQSGALRPAAVERRLTFHDPCYLGRYNNEYDAPRDVLTAAGVQIVEMERTRARSFCCGGGGGAPLFELEGDARIADVRMGQALTTGVEAVAVACPGCATMLEGARGLPVIDIAEVLWEAVSEAS